MRLQTRVTTVSPKVPLSTEVRSVSIGSRQPGATSARQVNDATRRTNVFMELPLLEGHLPCEGAGRAAQAKRRSTKWSIRFLRVTARECESFREESVGKSEIHVSVLTGADVHVCCPSPDVNTGGHRHV